MNSARGARGMEQGRWDGLPSLLFLLSFAVSKKNNFVRIILHVRKWLSYFMHREWGTVYAMPSIQGYLLYLTLLILLPALLRSSRPYSSLFIFLLFSISFFYYVPPCQLCCCSYHLTGFVCEAHGESNLMGIIWLQSVSVWVSSPNHSSLKSSFIWKTYDAEGSCIICHFPLVISLYVHLLWKIRVSLFSFQPFRNVPPIYLKEQYISWYHSAYTSPPWSRA